MDRRDYLPDEAVSLAARIFTEHLALFCDLTEVGKDMEIMVEREEEEEASVLDMTIEELDLSVRSYNCLKRAGVNTVEAAYPKNRRRYDESTQSWTQVAGGSSNKLASLDLSLRPKMSKNGSSGAGKAAWILAAVGLGFPEGGNSHGLSQAGTPERASPGYAKKCAGVVVSLLSAYRLRKPKLRN
jgi:hypothetical protein